MAESVIKQSVGASSEYIAFGSFVGTIFRNGKLRIINVYNSADQQDQGTWQLEHSYDYPAKNAITSAWLPVSGDNSFGSCSLSVNTNGVVSTSRSIFRGGFILIYYTN